MILQLIKYQKTVAWFLFLNFYLLFVKTSLYAGTSRRDRDTLHYPVIAGRSSGNRSQPEQPFISAIGENSIPRVSKLRAISVSSPHHHPAIGGPSQPEMASFKSVGTDHMVDLFTGSFSYNIPLLDVGGYPVNIFYDGNVGLEQEAGWVGVGWNINPGSVTRNMRGVPDDFDGTDTLVEQQQLKPKKIWNVNLSADLEGVGIKGLNLGNVGVGVSFDNYLGPALSLSAKGGTSFTLAGEVGGSDKSLMLSIGIGANLSSRTGLSILPNVSLDVSGSNTDVFNGAGIGLSTSYNSRVGVQALQLSAQTKFNTNSTTANNILSRLGKYSTTISFAKPTYLPALHMPLTNTNVSGEAQVGLGIFGIAATADAEVSESRQEIAAADVVQRKPLVGYLYYQRAVSNPDAVMDFTRFNDKEVTPHTPIIAAPQYAYDVFSIQGEGTGGSIRPFRNDLGYVRDNATYSKDNSQAFGADVGIPGHYGADYANTKTPTAVGEWNAGNKLRLAVPFTDAAKTWENVYFRNPGENCVQPSPDSNGIGGLNLVKYVIDGQPSSPSIEPRLQLYDPGSLALKGTVTVKNPLTGARKKRAQAVDFLTASEAAVIGLDKSIKSYDAQALLDGSNNLKYTSISRVGGYRKDHHISQVNVTEADGKRYVYGLPVYNITQQDFTFSIPAPADVDTDRVAVGSSLMQPSSPLLGTGSASDGYVQVTQTPAYAHAFLLTGLLSPDYVDVTGDGITDDDIGSAVQFDYTRIKDAGTSDGWAVHKWRTPLSAGTTANFNPGNRTETKDDKGIVSYGERESWYLRAISSRTMIAIFTLANRNDGKGALGAGGDVDAGDTSLKRLDRIDLYSKADLKKNGLAGARPIKTVHFCYSYSLCKGTPDNTNTDSIGGRLTLDSIYFTYNGQHKLNKEKYVFSYVDSAGKGNPDYQFGAADRWGNYKPATMNPGGMKNRDYPYSIQDKAAKTAIDENAGAWALKRILLPSGGQMEISYESNDYAYVQNKPAADMLQLAGFGKDTNTITPQLFELSSGSLTEHDIVFVKVPQACRNKTDVYRNYLYGTDQLAFKLAVYMPKGIEYLRSYATLTNGNYGIYPGDTSGKTIWIQLDRVDNVGALSLTAVDYLRQQLPGQAFAGYDVSGEATLAQVADMLTGMLAALKEGFSSPVSYLRGEGKTMMVKTAQSFVRLNDPDGFKYGGGRRVKSILLKDNWKAMTGQYNSVYGQTYDYTTTEASDGKMVRTISSGVATYEPSVGGEENPFQISLQVKDQLPLGPASYGSVEMPVLDAFYPAPFVGYSKVTVRSVNTNTDTTKRSRSGIGKQVTEYYTSKDFPTYSVNTNLDPSSDIEQHVASTSVFWSQYAYDYRALSQGFLVVNNDMNGKMRSQTSYAENDESTPVNYTENFYRNTGMNGGNDLFSFADNTQGGAITQGNMGIDVELMTDTREFATSMNSWDVQGQVDLYPIVFPFWIPFIWGTTAQSENIYRAVTTTKVISYHAVLDSVVVIDKGSQVSTKNLVYDAETGNVVVSRTNNEFDQPLYKTTYPAYWAYSGMGPAYKNIDATDTASFYNGQLTSGGFDQSIFESGDELYVSRPASASSGCTPVSAPVARLWVLDTSKNTRSLTNVTPHFIFIDSVGNPYTGNAVSFKIVRSGKRNQLNTSLAEITSMNSPEQVKAGILKLVIDSTSKVLQATASELKEKWQVDNEAINTYTATQVQQDQCTSTTVLTPACPGNVLEQVINPYRKGLLGNFKQYRSLVFYGDRKETDPAAATDLPVNGVINGFKPYWDFNASGNLVPDTSDKNWVWNEQVTKVNSRGLELETKNALDIYTAAQYGYDKDLAVGITNNARSNEAFCENFEDRVYQPGLANDNGTVCTPFVTFIGAGKLVNTDTTGFRAHTGKYVLGVAPPSDPNYGTFHNTVVPAKAAVADTFGLTYGNYTPVITSLVNPGGNVDSAHYQSAYLVPTYTADYGFTYDQYTYSSGGSKTDSVNFKTYVTNLLNEGFLDSFYNHSTGRTDELGTGCSLRLLHDMPSDLDERHSGICPAGGPQSGAPYDWSSYTSTFSIILSQYVRIDAMGTYALTYQHSNNWQYWAGSYIPCTGYAGGTQNPQDIVQLYSVDSSGREALVGPATLNTTNITGGTTLNGVETDETYSLCPGIYKIDYSVYEYYILNMASTTPLQLNFNYSYNFQNSNSSGPQPVGYKNLNTVQNTGCTSVVPIAATKNMLNPVFSVTPGKKMVFGAWVREECPSGGSCAATSYTHNRVELQYKGGVLRTDTLYPSGPIIDGWQRYEGYFTAPAGDTSVTLNFVNTGNNMIYFDDIRIHPFNANMKSYVYDPVSLRLLSTLDENNYATFYEYDEEGTLIRTKAETLEGIKTINETRSAKQKNINQLQ